MNSRWRLAIILLPMLVSACSGSSGGTSNADTIPVNPATNPSSGGVVIPTTPTQPGAPVNQPGPDTQTPGQTTTGQSTGQSTGEN